MKQTVYTIACWSILAGSLVSCTKDLDRFPTNDVTSETVYSTPLGYKQSLAKVYGAFALTGNAGPAGAGDIRGIDEGTSDFLRLFWKAQELSTDEAVVAWNDPGIQDFHNMNWSSSNPMLIGLYNRSFYQITLVNAFLRESTADRLSSRGIGGADATEINYYRAEARFLRAFQYWALMDLFGNVPFVTEENAIGATFPPQIKRADLFNYIESELKAIETELKAPRANEYGRADQGAAWALMARLYLNAQVYTGTARYTDAITYAKKVIDAGYTLTPNYDELFLADNNTKTNEIIFTINYDGIQTKNFGGTTFLVHASVGDNMNPNDFGVDGGWYGIRSTKNLPLLFPDPATGTTDERANFVANKLEIDDITKFSDGYAVSKFRNLKSNGGAPNDPAKTFVDTDFPLFRLSEMYLIYAEAVLRGGTGGSQANAVTYINALRQRAYNNASGNVTGYTTDFVLDERGRELYWEGHRRTDLIRYGRFTGANYLWPWKGGIKAGRGVDAFRALYPLPVTDVVANPNLEQNPGY